MLTRRALLLSVGPAALSGCALTGGTTPTPAASPTDLLAGQRALLAWEESLGAVNPAADDVTLLTWLRDVTAEQKAATSLGTPAPPASPAPSGTQAALSHALQTAHDAYARQALDASTAHPLVWASMAAWCAATGPELEAPTARREPVRAFTMPAAQTPDEARQDALNAAHATGYGLQVAAGTIGLGEEDASALASRLSWWAGLRDDIDALASPATGTTPPPAVYAIERPADATAARAMAAELQASALAILGRSIAHGDATLRTLLVPALAVVATDLPRWGGLLQRWPGLPLT